MDDRRLESIGQTTRRGARQRAGDAQDMTTRASGYAQELAERAGDYVSRRARDVGDQVERLTGRPADAWMREARRFVQDHPLRAVVLTIALGFVLGKLLARE